MKSVKSLPAALTGILASALVLAIASCAFQKGYLDSHEKLSRNIKVFNSEFEARSLDASPLLVKTDKREEFMMKAPEIKKKAIFDEISIVNTEYFKKGAPVKQSGGLPTQDFDETVLTLRYQLVVLPSNRLETRVVKQKWLLEDEDWVVVPELDSFLK